MADFLHERRDFDQLLAVVANDRALDPMLVEKDYWIMHSLWGLQAQGFVFELKGGTSLSKGFGVIHRFSEDIDIRIEPPADMDVKTGRNQDKPAHIDSRRAYYDELSKRIRIPGIDSVERDTFFDDEKMRSAGTGSRWHQTSWHSRGLTGTYGHLRVAKDNYEQMRNCWWGVTPHQTTIESTESKRCGLLRTIANSIGRSAGAPCGRGRSSRFFALIGARKGCSTSSAFPRQFNSRFGNRTRVRQIATFHSRNWPTVCVRPCLSRVSRYSSVVLGGFFSDRRWLAAASQTRAACRSSRSKMKSSGC